MSFATGYIVETQTLSLPAQNTDSVFTLTWTNLGPLTTTFTPAVGCHPPTPEVYANSVYSGGSYGIAWPCYRAAATPSPTRYSCEPSGSAVSSIILDNWSSYYSWQTFLSPGISCPSGYSTAVSATVGSEGLASAFTLQTSGTHVWCCPNGYTFDQSQFGCTTGIKTALQTGLCDPACTTGADCTVPTLFSWNPAETSVTVSGYLDAIYMIHQDSDLLAPSDSTASSDPVTPSSKTSSTSINESSSSQQSGSPQGSISTQEGSSSENTNSTKGTTSSQSSSSARQSDSNLPSTTAQQSNTPQQDNTAQQSDSGLSIGAKIAIGVVVPIVVLIAIACGALVFMTKLKKRRELRISQGQTASTGTSPFEVQQVGYREYSQAGPPNLGNVPMREVQQL